MSVSAFAQEDAEGCKDSPMFPNRMPNYVISQCASNFDEADFNTAPEDSKMVHKEGTKTLSVCPSMLTFKAGSCLRIPEI